MGRGMGGNQGMLSDMQYRGGDFDDMSHALPPSYGGGPDPRMRADIPRQLEGTPQPAENMPQQYSPQEYLRQGLQMQAQNAAMKNRGGMEASPQYQDTNMNMAMPAVMPQRGYGRNSQQMDLMSQLFAS